MVPNEEGWYYLAVKKLSALLRKITSKQDGDSYCLNFLHSFRIKNKLNSHKKVCENKNAVIPTKFNLYHQSLIIS